MLKSSLYSIIWCILFGFANILIRKYTLWRLSLLSNNLFFFHWQLFHTFFNFNLLWKLFTYLLFSNQLSCVIIRNSFPLHLLISFVFALFNSFIWKMNIILLFFILVFINLVDWCFYYLFFYNNALSFYRKLINYCISWLVNFILLIKLLKLIPIYSLPRLFYEALIN